MIRSVNLRQVRMMPISAALNNLPIIPPFLPYVVS